jgi:hypothetical protein
MKSSEELESKLKALADSGVLGVRTENNPYLKVSYKGTDGIVSSKWNVKIYTSGSVICNDPLLLKQILQDKLKEADKSLKVLKIDDAGGGFPLCGVMVGVTDGEQVITDVVPVEYFQSPAFEKQAYLRVYAELGVKIVMEHFDADIKTHRIEICTGFINSRLRNLLREKGFDVRVTEITGLLQDKLEHLFREYVKQETGVTNLGYDPKEVKAKKALGQLYYNALNWGKRNAPHLLKSGWESMK